MILPPRDDGPCCVLAASPRPGGNTDTAARLFLQGFSLAGPEEEAASGIRDDGSKGGPSPVYLRSYKVDPCISCNACTLAAQRLTSLDPKDSGTPGPGPLLGCPLTLRDDSAPLLGLLATAKALCLVSPIYFYHLPAALKALVDRVQPFWVLREAGITRYSANTPRTCHVILLAGRSRGDRLFAGSLLTLKYAFDPLNIRLADPLLLRGLDAPAALLGRPGDMQSIVAYGEDAAKIV
jgi:multimeric flavodoxin WrbA